MHKISDLSFSNLENFGLSKSTCNTYKKFNLLEILWWGHYEFRNFLQFPKSVIDKVKKSWEKMSEKFDNHVQVVLDVFDFLKKGNKTSKEFIAFLNFNNLSDEEIRFIHDSLLAIDEISFFNEKYYIKNNANFDSPHMSTIFKWILWISNDEEKIALNQYLNSKSIKSNDYLLKKICEKISYTSFNEKVIKFIKSNNVNYLNLSCYFYKNNIQKNEIMNIFNENEFSLYCFLKKYLNFTKSNIFDAEINCIDEIEELDFKNEKKQSFKSLIHEFLSENNSKFYNTSEIKSSIIKKYGVDIQDRYIEGACENMLDIVSDGGHKYKKIDFDLLSKNDINYMETTINSKNGLFSFEHFFKNEFKEICGKIGITTYNSLHNFCKKNIKINEDIVTFRRMPNIVIGYKNDIDFYKEYIFSNYEKVEIKKISKELYDKFGLNELTSRSMIPTLLKENYHNGYLEKNLNIISDDDFIKLKGVLINDIYSHDEILDIFSKYNIDHSYINRPSLKKLGYQYQYNYSIKDGTTVEKIIINTSSKIPYNSSLLSKYGISDHNYVVGLRKTKKIIKISEDNYTESTIFSERIFNLNSLQELINDIKNYNFEKSIFTANEVIKIFGDKYNKIKDLSTECLFYALTSWYDLFSVNNNFFILSKTKGITLKKYIIDKIKHKNKITSFDLCREISEDLGIEYTIDDISKLNLSISGEVYYNSEGKIYYKNKNIMLEEIKDE